MVRKLRTAVLVVHGMGSQRPLETARGVINAVWFDDDDHIKDEKKLWSHPEPSGVDLDLTVMTTNPIPESTDRRVADFHELYWAHHMSETKAVAVLLWLFELGRRGPYFRSRMMNGLWWCGAIFLCLLLLSATELSVQAMIWFSNVGPESYGIPITAYLMIGVAVTIGCVTALLSGYWRLAMWLFAAVATVALIGYAGFYIHEVIQGHHISSKLAIALATNVLLVPFIAAIATALLMHKPGMKAFFWALLLSWSFFGMYLFLIRLGVLTDSALSEMLLGGRIPWGLNSKWSCVAALFIFGIYLIVDNWFLQPYLGDAARYFRNSPGNVAVRRAIRKDAVDTLDQLHRSRNYDRIVVVAHSLGTAVAYDMLRAYYSRICSQIPVDSKLKRQFDKLDSGALDRDEMRAEGRRLIREFVERSTILSAANREGMYRLALSQEVDAWLVTDFVTLGSPLTHAKYLMANEEHGERLENEFFNHVHEREFPTCPPQKLDDDGLIFFKDPRGNLRVHHGGVFATTRWTNLYFPVSNILWGDAIGGPVADVFCAYPHDKTPDEIPPSCIKDMPVTTRIKGGDDLFTHVAYWKTDCRPDRRKAPHLQALIGAINLADKP